MSVKVVFDEMGDYFGGLNDGLKEELRAIEGVPNAAYLVQGGQVFVFDKLVRLVQERRSDHLLPQLARTLIAEATVTAKEAVETWGVVPEPYEMATGAELMIRHRPFNSRLPGIFTSKSELQDAFAQLLLGGIQPGNGDFSYRGQRMTLCDPLDIALLPPRPSLQFEEAGEKQGHASLATVEFQADFEPVSRALFDDAKAREVSWKNDSTRAAWFAREHAGGVWARAATLRLEELNDPSDEVPDYGQDDSAALRPLYPELPMLSDGSLYAWFDRYQVDCCYLSGWTACRDDDFLFYLLGKVAEEEHLAKDVGQWVGYSLLRGDSLHEALSFGRAANIYDRAISSLARRIADAMRFVAHDNSASDRRGRPITTLMDSIQFARGAGFTVSLVQQDFAVSIRQ